MVEMALPLAMTILEEWKESFSMCVFYQDLYIMVCT